jgi:hypothetical protein
VLNWLDSINNDTDEPNYLFSFWCASMFALHVSFQHRVDDDDDSFQHRVDDDDILIEDLDSL